MLLSSISMLLLRQQQSFDCAKAKRQQQEGFDCAKAKRQQQEGFDCAKAKRQQQQQLRQGEIDLWKKKVR
ncbi:hypothetical protein [Lysinibacillus sp. NPDC096259]|uniref:hypothetical protein n=1 Tax=Lysinibacillus sp. NPDC096259 TaxID=3390583 RepID=UPI003D07CAFA